jgi:hypothetical protein
MGASTGLVTFMVLANYFLLALKTDEISTLIAYGVVCGLFSTALGLMSGAIALLASFKFNLTIFRKENED